MFTVHIYNFYILILVIFIYLLFAYSCQWYQVWRDNLGISTTLSSYSLISKFIQILNGVDLIRYDWSK